MKFKLFKRHKSKDSIKFTVECEMKERWIPYFLALLSNMEYLGNIGSSRPLGFYADGDGDFRPQFKVKRTKFTYPEGKQFLDYSLGKKDVRVSNYYDAG